MRRQLGASPVNDKDAVTKSYVDGGLAAKQDVTDKGQPGGYASLGSDGKVPTAQLPTGTSGSSSSASPASYEINVKDYGALGNGVANDTAAINAAIAALTPGATLRFPPGRYMTNGGHVITTPSVVIKGPTGRAQVASGTGSQVYNSQAQLYLRSGANADMLTIAALQVTIRDLSLYGAYNTQTARSRGIVFSGSARTNYFLLDAVWVSTFRGDGFVFDGNNSSTTVTETGTTSGTVVNCESRKNLGFGMRFNPKSTDLMLTNCYVDENALSGLYINTSDVSLTSCHIWGNGTGEAYTYAASRNLDLNPYITNGTNPDGSPKVIQNGNEYKDGITFYAAAGCRVVNCNIESQHSGGAGIRFATGWNYSHIIMGCDIWGNGQQGIYAFAAERCAIIGNTIRENGYNRGFDAAASGIVVNSCTSLNITGNVFYGQSYLPSQTYGYYEQGTANSDILFHSNVFSNHKTGEAVFGPGTITAARRYTTANRPAATTVGAGYQIYDTTLNRLLWSDGTAWLNPDTVTATLTGKTLSGASNTFSAIPQSAVTGLATDLAARESTANKGVANGYASLGSDGKVPTAQLPSSIGGGAVASVNGYTGTVVLAKSDVGLGDVDNTSDATKNSATATLTNKTLTNPTLGGTVGNLYHAGKVALSLYCAATADSQANISTAAGGVVLDVSSATAADVNLTLRPKGAGVVRLENSALTKAAILDLSSLTAYRTFQFPDATTTLVGTGTTQTLTGKTLSGASNTFSNIPGSAVTTTVNAQTGTTYTLALADSGALVTLANSGAVTLTIPTNASVAFPTGSQIRLAQLGAGQVTVVGAGGVTVNGTPGLKTAAQYAGAMLHKIGTDTWLLTGTLSA